MPIKLTLPETFDAYISLKKFSKKELKDDLLSYLLGNLETSTLKPATLFEKIRLSMIKKHGIEDKEGNIFVPPSKEEDYKKELDEKLSEAESGIEKDLTFDTIKRSLFKGVDVAPEFFRGMGKLIENA